MSESNRDHTTSLDIMTTTTAKEAFRASSSRNDSDHEDEDLWELQIKMVGNEQVHGAEQSDFVITLHPNDDIIQLYHEITIKTGLPYHQQRLIYRGRLLPNCGGLTTHHQAKKSNTTTTTEDVSLFQPTTIAAAAAADESLLPLMKDSTTSTTTTTNSTTTKTVPSTLLLLNQKIRDIVGLMNGHSIHLVVRRRTDSSGDDVDETDDDEENDAAVTNGNITSDPATASLSSSSGSSSLLAALLGMGGGSNTGSGGTTTDRTATATRSTQSRNGGNTYRLTEDDFIRPDPGSLETVRQGLMSFHTVQQFHSSTGHNSVAPNRDCDAPDSTTTVQPTILTTDTGTGTQPRRRRNFYLGQWIDCRDTVNQWLEATVVSILYPRDIIHNIYPTTITSTATNASLSSNGNRNSNTNTNSLSTFQPTTDPPIAVTDFDGRRRLLLEECTESESEETIDGIHYRRRRTDNEEDIQILHIHYNGWPVRWDEWIRSDSERIRVFRTRTRHHNNNNTSSSSSSSDQAQRQQYVSPNIDSIMPDAPYTFITNSEDNDRVALLPELHRAIQMLQNQLDRVTSVSAVSNPNAVTTTTTPTLTSRRRSHLPWIQNNASVIEVGIESLEQHTSQQGVYRRRRQQELEALGPLLDRLGRVFIDAAPHVLALADTIDLDNDGDDDDESDQNQNEDMTENDDHEPEPIPPATNTLGGLLSLLNRDRRGRGSVASSSNAALPSIDVEMSTVASSTASSMVAPAAVELVDNRNSNNNSTNDFATSNIVDPYEVNDEEGVDDNEVVEYIAPDYRDYATGLVNTTRGDARTTTGSSSSQRRGSSSDDGTTSLLGAYLAAMSLGGIASISTGDGDEGNGGGEGFGRLLRDRGSGTGIDIHIHAVVTAPGLDGAIGFAALTAGGGGGTTFPVATPVAGHGATTNGTNGGLGNLFGGSTSNRRGGSRRFRSVTPTTNDEQQQAAVVVTNFTDDNDVDLFAELYSETPDPINPTTYTVPAGAVVDDPNEESFEHQEHSTPSPLRQNGSRSRSLRRPSTNHSQNMMLSTDNSGEQQHIPIPRNYRGGQRSNTINEQRHSSNSNLLRRIFRRPDNGH